MSDTPRTDVRVTEINRDYPGWGPGSAFALANHARALERELSAARETALCAQVAELDAKLAVPIKADDTHDILRGLVAQARCKPGWFFLLKNENGALRFVVRVSGFDSSRPDERVPMTVDHYFPVPTATYNEKTWRRWMFEMCRRVENHELGEWFRIGSEWPFAPLHGPGEDPYTVHEFRSVEDALTTQDGTMRQPYARTALGEPKDDKRDE